MATKPNSQTLFITISTFLLLATTTLTAADFIKTSCAATTYPSLCIHSLTPYAPAIKTSTRRLAITALTVSLSTAQSTKSYVRKLQPSKPREAAAVKDCAEEIEDTVDRLSRSIKELKAMGASGEEFQWHLSNIETWVSAALTDENTCVDGFGGKVMDGEMKDEIRVRFLRTARVTSNALALINKFGRRH